MKLHAECIIYLKGIHSFTDIVVIYETSTLYAPSEGNPENFVLQSQNTSFIRNKNSTRDK